MTGEIVRHSDGRSGGVHRVKYSLAEGESLWVEADGKPYCEIQLRPDCNGILVDAHDQQQIHIAAETRQSVVVSCE